MASGSKVRTSNGVGLIAPKNPYSRVASAAGFERLVVTAGQLGADLTPGSDGRLAEGFAAQVRQALVNLRIVLAGEGMTVDDIMALHHCVVGRQDLAALNAERVKFLGRARPTSLLMVVSGLWNPDALYEVAAIAAR
jgi:2-iminobutanoate/2-iminopropanoate deaminase